MALKVIAANKFVLLAAAVACSVLLATFAMVVGNGSDVRYDRFGVQEIYPTKKGGYEWYVNPANPRDGMVISPAATPLSNEGGGSWRISRMTSGPNDGVRMYVISPTMWSDVEMTGYVKLESFSFDEEFAWAARSGKHSPDNICEATAYFGALGFSGNSWFQKKMFHGEGYTDRRASPIQVYDLQNRWVGVKLVAYNINVDSSVKLELWLDDRPDNHWVKIAETIDSGNWNTDSPSNCGKTRDYVISEPRPRVLFRVDNASFEFKNLSVREIDPAGQS